MLTYSYTARNPKTGKHIKSTVQADSEQAAAKLIQNEGLVTLSIKKPGGASLEGINKYLNKVSTKDKVLFSRQLSTLINAGLPIIQSLQNVADQTTSKPFKETINQIISDVEGGSTLSGAMAKHPRVFNQIYISLVASGETSGTLDKSLERLAIQQEKDADLISKIRGALAYPIIVIIVMLAVVGFMLVKVLPQVEVIYNGLPGAQLPLITRILLAISHAIIKYWWIVLLGLFTLIIGGTRWARYTAGGRQVVDLIKMKMWPTGQLFMKMYMARFSRTAGTLVSSGVPIIQVLEITANAINNVHIEAAIKRAIDKVKGGKTLSEALLKEPVFLVLVPNMLRIGEQSGSIEKMLDKTADFYEKEVDNQVKTISTLIEPVLMVLLGIVAFTIVAAVLLPIYGLANQGLGSSSSI